MDALADLVDEEPGLVFVGTARSDMETIVMALSDKPDIFLFDLDAIDVDAARIARDVIQYLPSSRLVALSTHTDAASVQRAFGAGFHRYVNKGSDIADLLPVLSEDFS